MWCTRVWGLVCAGCGGVQAAGIQASTLGDGGYKGRLGWGEQALMI